MSKQIKLIWDFYGTDANKIAQHHEVHLKQFIALENLKDDITITGFESVENNYAIAFLVVDENEMIKVRDTLKPHRGEIYTNN